ncbi:MAG: DUF4419 domain-containing protein [Bacteroidales bacterium]|nr:DUF4419 domain-containing protein [Bacteroidales bacterium]
MKDYYTRNSEYSEYAFNPYIDGEDYYISKFMISDFPSGISKYEFKWKYEVGDTNEVYDMEIYAGFVGFAQNKETKSLRPEISWAIRDEKSPWLGAYNFPNAKLGKKPIEYWYSYIVNKPDAYPIFRPDTNKTYIDSENDLENYIKKEVKKIKEEQELNGIVKVKFVITWGGTIADVKIVESAGSKEDICAINLIKSLPKWKPAKKIDYFGGQIYYKVNYAKTLTIDFNDE